MPKLLASAFSEQKPLTTTPELLAIRVPQYWDREDGSRQWLRGCDIQPVWGSDAKVTLHICGADVVYCLRAYIEYIIDGKDVEPTIYMRHDGGHFVAHFEEGGQWYTADDLGHDRQVVQWPIDTPHKVPFVCFLEREDSRAHHAAVSPWVVGPINHMDDSDDEAEIVSEEDASEDADPAVEDEKDSGSGAAKPSTRGRKRKRSQDRAGGTQDRGGGKQ